MKTRVFLLCSLFLFLGCDPSEQTIAKEPQNTVALTFADFQKNLKAGMDYNSITEVFGAPLKDIGSGIHIYVYRLSDATEIWIGYTSKILYARHVDPNQNILDSLF